MSTLTVLRKVLSRLTPYRALFLLAVLQVIAIGVLELAKPWPLKVVAVSYTHLTLPTILRV